MENKHAYLIMAHDEFYILEKLILLLDSVHNDIYIHIDKKIKNFDFDYFRKLPKKSTVFFINRIKIYWGDFSQIKCEIALLQSAFNKGYEYYHLISGVDLPLKNAECIYEFFSNNKYEYITFNDCYCDDRVKYYYLKFLKRNNFFYQLNRIFVRLQEIFRINRIKNVEFEFKNGIAWYSITNDLAKYILDNKTFIDKYFKNGICTDEMHVQTLVWNSEFKNKVYELNENDPVSSYRCIDWKRGKPYTFDIDDYNLLINSNCFFARKFSTQTEKQKKLVDEIYNYVKNE